MTEITPDEGTLPNHLEHLAATADDVVAMLTRSHKEGEIHADTLAKSEKLATGLRQVIDALVRHDPKLAADSSDVWKMLTAKHAESEDGTVT